MSITTAMGHLASLSLCCAVIHSHYVVSWLQHRMIASPSPVLIYCVDLVTAKAE